MINNFAQDIFQSVWGQKPPNKDQSYYTEQSQIYQACQKIYTALFLLILYTEVISFYLMVYKSKWNNLYPFDLSPKLCYNFTPIFTPITK